MTGSDLGIRNTLVNRMHLIPVLMEQINKCLVTKYSGENSIYRVIEKNNEGNYIGQERARGGSGDV